MVWPFSRRRPDGEFPGEVGIVNGPQRSPGLKALSEELDKRPIEAVLDLGVSFHENLTYLSRYCGNIEIRDLMGAHGGDADGPRSSLFQIDTAALDSEGDSRYDAILLWDLLHYVERSQRKSFVGRLAEMSRPGALLLVLAAGSTPIPLSPVRFRIRDRESLIYEVRSDSRGPAPHFTPREIEKLMVGFRPVRYFQLRNGLQEYLFQYEDAAQEDGEMEEESKSSPKSPRQPGDWY